MDEINTQQVHLPKLLNVRTTYCSCISLAAVFSMYAFLVLMAQMEIVNRPTASLILIMGVYLTLKPSKIVHPATLIFVNYLLYFIVPYSLYLIYDLFEVEYVLPWGLINDWSKLSYASIGHFEFTFLIFFLSVLFCSEMLIGGSSPHSHVSKFKVSYDVSTAGVFALTSIIYVGVIIFLNHTGGMHAWLTNYSNTYLTAKEGIGLINFLLINLAHLLAFIAGWMWWRAKVKYHFLLWLFMLIVLILCIFFQGIKSRIPLLLFFFLMPKLSLIDIRLQKAFFVFTGLIIFFMVSMYFRSDGFYSTPRMAVEYLQSYFNTIFLHDIALSNFAQGEMKSMFMGFNKYAEIFVGKIPRESYDLSVALTQKFYPDTWYTGGATQQWPIETDFYLTFPSPLFWCLPIWIYAFFISFMYKLSNSGIPAIMFIYSAEFLRIMSIFRSGLLTWNVLIQFVFYVTVFIFSILLIFKKTRLLPNK